MKEYWVVFYDDEGDEIEDRKIRAKDEEDSWEVAKELHPPQNTSFIDVVLVEEN